MKEKWNYIQELWKNPKTHALIVLGLYAIFFGSIFLYIQFSPKKTDIPVHVSAIQKLETMNHYSYTLEINEEKITGQIHNHKNEFTYQGNDYDTSNLDANFPYQEIIAYVDTYTIYQTIKDLQYYSQTTYQDGSSSKVYQLDNIEIIPYEKDNKIYQIDIKTNQYTAKITYED